MVFGPRDIMWWGTLGFVLIEGFTLGIAMIIFLQQVPAAFGVKAGPSSNAAVSAGAEAGPTAGATAGRQDDVVEADYEIVDDDKK